MLWGNLFETMDKIFVLDKKYFVIDKINLSWTYLILSWGKNILSRQMDRAIVNLKFCETYPNLRRSRCSLCVLTLSKIKFLRFSQTDPMEFSWPREGQKNKVDGEIFPLYFGTLGIVLLYLLFDQWFLAPTYRNRATNGRYF